MKKISDVEVVKEKETVHNKLNRKIPDVSPLNRKNQYITDKQNLKKKTADVDKEILGISGLVTTIVLNTNTTEFDKKVPDTNGLVTTTVLNRKIWEFEEKIPDTKYVVLVYLINKRDYNAKISDMENKYFTTSIITNFWVK